MGVKIALGLSFAGIGLVAFQDPVQSADAAINCFYLFAVLTAVMIVAYFLCWIHFVFKKDNDRIELLAKAQADMVKNWNKLTDSDTKVLKTIIYTLPKTITTIFGEFVKLRSQEYATIKVLLPAEEESSSQDLTAHNQPHERILEAADTSLTSV
jgi:hypothetical protein